MDIIKELHDLTETVGNKIAEANKKIRKTNGIMDMSDIEIVDKLAHSVKCLVTTTAMLEAGENGGGYSGHYGPAYYPGESYGYSGRERRDDGYSGNRGGYSRNESQIQPGRLQPNGRHDGPAAPDDGGSAGRNDPDGNQKADGPDGKPAVKKGSLSALQRAVFFILENEKILKYSFTWVPYYDIIRVPNKGTENERRERG